MMVSPDVVRDRALVRSSIYGVLSKAFMYPTESLVDSLQMCTDAFADGERMNLLDADMQESLSAFLTALEQWCSPQCRETLEAEYNRLFAHLGSAQSPPYETEYGYDNVFQKAEAMADIAGFYAAYGLEPAATNAERVDFLSTELEFMAYVTMHEAYAREHNEAAHFDVCRDTQRKFLAEHLGRWVALFVQILLRSTANSFYTSAGKLMGTFLENETRLFGLSPEKVTAPNKTAASEKEPFGCAGCTAQTES